MAGQPFLQLFVADLQTDAGYKRCRAEGKAVWIQAICEMHTEDSDRVMGTYEDLALALAMPEAQVREGVSQLKKYDVCEVECDSHGIVTLISRRRRTQLAERENARIRKQNERIRRSEKKDQNTSHTEVTPPRAIARSDSDSVYDSDSSALSKEAEPQERPREKKFSAAQVESVYRTYPKRVGRRDALREIELALRRISRGEAGPDPPTEDPVGWLTDRTAEFAVSPAGTAGKFTPHPSTWYHQDRFDDDPAEWRRIEINHGKNGSTNGTQPLSARQYAGLSVREKLARGGFLDAA
jgi:hypothetical protein